MKTYYFLIAILLHTLSCKKITALNEPNFDVSSDSSTYRQGSITKFSFSGNPDNIIFYSGAKGNQYARKDRYFDTSGNVLLSFSTVVNTAGNSGNLNLFISDNYTNDTSKIANATWTDIGSFATINWATGATATSSGSIDLNRYKILKKPIYLAFKYVADSAVTQKKWTISSLALTHQPVGDTTYTLATTAVTLPNYIVGSLPLISSPGWVAVNTSRNPTAAQRWAPTVATASTTSLTVGGNSNALTAIATEQWIIAGPIDLTAVLHDVPTAIVKNSLSLSAEQLQPAFSFRYAKIGVYDATFVGINANNNNRKSLEKYLKIIVN